jgi:flagellar protein FliS
MYMAQAQFGAARARYQSIDIASRIEGASPHTLVAIMFEELLKALDTMAAAIRQKDIVKRGRTQARSLSILHGLEGSLDFERGAEIAAGLATVYREARRLTVNGGRENDADQIVRARDMLAEIAGAWQAIGQ